MAKQAITILSGEETFKNLQTFENIKQLNETVRAYKERFKGELSKTALLVLETLQRYSAKYTGVSFLTKNKLAEMVGKSRRTIIRVCQQLEQMGIIRQYEMKRKTDMQQTSNAVVIQPVQKENVTQEKNEKPVKPSTQKQEMSHQRKQALFSKTNTYKTKRIKKREMDSSYVSDSVPKEFTKVAASFDGFNNADTIEELWKMVRISNYHTNYDKGTIIRVALESFKQMVRKHVKGKVENPFAYFYGVLNKKMDVLFFEDLEQFGGHYYADE